MFFVGLAVGFVLGALWMLTTRIVVKMRRDNEEKLQADNSAYAAALQDLKMFIHGRLQVHPELQCELGFIWERLNLANSVNT